MIYVAVDVGCIECGEPTTVVGLFRDKAEAIDALAKAQAEQEANWTGQHSFELFEVEDL